MSILRRLVQGVHMASGRLLCRLGGPVAPRAHPGRGGGMDEWARKRPESAARMLLRLRELRELTERRHE